MSTYRAVEDLHLLLRLDWVREWAGWREAAAALGESMDDAQLEAAAGDYAPTCQPTCLAEQRRARKIRSAEEERIHRTGEGHQSRPGPRQ